MMNGSWLPKIKWLSKCYLWDLSWLRAVTKSHIQLSWLKDWQTSHLNLASCTLRGPRSRHSPTMHPSLTRTNTENGFSRMCNDNDDACINLKTMPSQAANYYAFPAALYAFPGLPSQAITYFGFPAGSSSPYYYFYYYISLYLPRLLYLPVDGKLNYKTVNETFWKNPHAKNQSIGDTMTSSKSSKHFKTPWYVNTNVRLGSKMASLSIRPPGAENYHIAMGTLIAMWQFSLPVCPSKHVSSSSCSHTPACLWQQLWLQAGALAPRQEV